MKQVFLLFTAKRRAAALPETTSSASAPPPLGALSPLNRELPVPLPNLYSWLRTREHLLHISLLTQKDGLVSVLPRRGMDWRLPPQLLFMVADKRIYLLTLAPYARIITTWMCV